MKLKVLDKKSHKARRTDGWQGLNFLNGSLGLLKVVFVDSQLSKSITVRYDRLDMNSTPFKVNRRDAYMQHWTLLQAETIMIHSVAKLKQCLKQKLTFKVYFFNKEFRPRVLTCYLWGFARGRVIPRAEVHNMCAKYRR